MKRSGCWMKRYLWTVTMLMVAACSAGPRDAAKSSGHATLDSGSKASKATDPAAASSGVKSPTVSEVEAEKAEVEQNGEFRTLFRAILGGGYGSRPAKVTEKYQTYCRSSYANLIKDPQAVRPFLERKLREGRVNERPLAIHLLGSLGADALASGRYVAGVAVRSWDVVFNRCVAKSRGETLKGRPPEATPEERQMCVDKLGGSRPPSSLRMACTALRKIGDKASVSRLLKTGLNGYFARPCALYIVENDLKSPEALRFIAGELDGKPNGDILWSGLVRRGAEGVAAILKILEARARSKKVYDEPMCLSARFMQSYRAEGGTLTELSEETRARLTTLASGKLGDGLEVPSSVKSCALKSLEALKASPPSRVRPLRKLKADPGLAPFCP